MSDAMRKAFSSVRNFAEDTLERVERRWDQAMDVIHARPIRDPTRDDALGGGEQFAAQARERLDYQLKHPGPGEIAERHADLAGDATVDKSQIDKIIRQEVGQARNKEQPNTREQLLEKFAVDRPVSWEVVGNRQILPFVEDKGNKVMSHENTNHNRQRESMAWTKVEEIGRQAVAADRAAQTQTQTQAQTQASKSKADEDLEKAKPRQSQTP